MILSLTNKSTVMASNMCTSWVRLKRALQQFELILYRWIGSSGYSEQIPAIEGLPFGYGENAGTSLEELLQDPFMRKKATTNNRWSKERVKTRRLSDTHVKQWGTPKTNIVTCLECGAYHERHTICGNCYEKVRQETREMKKAMGDALTHNTPRSEVVFVYEDEEEDRPKYNGKYIVEMKKPRPQWFADNLLGLYKKPKNSS